MFITLALYCNVILYFYDTAIEIDDVSKIELACKYLKNEHNLNPKFEKAVINKKPVLIFLKRNGVIVEDSLELEGGEAKKYIWDTIK